MKYSHLRTPRQMSDAQFSTGNGDFTGSTHPADRVMLVLAAFVAGLIFGGLI